MFSATPAAMKQQPFALFKLTEEEHRLLQHVADRPRRWTGFSPDATDYLMRRHLARACRRGRVLAITTAGKGTLEAISLLG
jgi:hypothetical protein